MTIRVTIKNDDPRETAVVEVRVCMRSEPHGLVVGINPTDQAYEVRSGQSIEQWVHSGQDLLVREVSQ
jgi:hypothetical protein